MKAYFDVTLDPAFRFFAVCVPEEFDGTMSRGRRRRRAVGLARECAPPHYRKISNAHSWDQVRAMNSGNTPDSIP